MVVAVVEMVVVLVVVVALVMVVEVVFKLAVLVVEVVVEDVTVVVDVCFLLVALILSAGSTCLLFDAPRTYINKLHKLLCPSYKCPTSVTFACGSRSYTHSHLAGPNKVLPSTPCIHLPVVTFPSLGFNSSQVGATLLTLVFIIAYSVMKRFAYGQ